MEMTTDTFLYRSDSHQNYNEDALILDQVGEEWLVAGVMDGCSAGKESHFMSGLLVKLLRKSIKTLPYLEQVSPEYSLKDLPPEVLGEIILNQIFDESKKMVKGLLMEYEEALSTLLLMVFNTESRELFINVSGDGFYEVNGAVHEVDHNNAPDFMGYHLKKSFAEWYRNHTESHVFSKVSTASISTDGISKFMNAKRKLARQTAEMFLVAQKKPKLYSQTFESLTNELSLLPLDDIAIVGFRGA